MKKRKNRIIFIGSDHAGFNLKEKIKSFLKSHKIEFEDLGPFVFNQKDDYPEFALRVAKKVASTKNSFGILVCSSAAGMCIVANKVKNIRAVAAYDSKTAKLSRLHNNSNILCLSADFVSSSKNLQILKVWISTDFSNELRHIRRIKQISSIENIKWKYK